MSALIKNRFLVLSIFAIFVSVSLIGVGITATMRGENKVESKLESEKPASDNRLYGSAANGIVPTTVPVRMFKVGSQNAKNNQRTFTGTVRARYETPVGFRVSGKILLRRVDVGQKVQKGDVLFELDSEDYTLQQKSAEANLRVASASVMQSTAEERRLSELRRANAISQSEYDLGLSARDIALGQQASAQRQLELSNNQLAYCRLIADTSGIVTNIQAEAGQVVSAGTPVCVVAQLNELDAVIDIPENRSSISSELLATVQFWSLPDQKVNAKLRELSPVADPVTRTYRARFAIINPPEAVHLGMTATVSWGSELASDRLDGSPSEQAFPTTIPSSSIIEHNGSAAVWLATPEEENSHIYRIRPQPIEVSNYGEQMIEVSSGLTSGQFIVSAGVQKLDAAMRVRVWEMQK